MFKKTTMSLALTAAMIGGVTMTQQSFAAIQSSMTDSTGDILLYPYYSVDNGFRTLIHLVNTSKTDTTIAKIRLRDYENSDDVLDFTVILSPNDVFAGTIKAYGDNGVVLTHGDDTTCTSPNTTSFYPSHFMDTSRSGHIEVITMATINKDELAKVPVGTYKVLEDIVAKSTHDSNGNNTSDDCSTVDSYFAQSGIKALQQDLVAYTNGTDVNGDPLDPVQVPHSIASNLMGHYTILNMDNGIQGGGRPSTIAGALDGTLVSPCDMTGAANNTIICGQYTEHYEFPNLMHVEGVDAVTGGVDAANVTAFNAVFGATDDNNGGLTVGTPSLVSFGIANEWSRNSDATSSVDSEWTVTLPVKYVYRDDYPASTSGDTSKSVFTTASVALAELDMWDDTTAALFADQGIKVDSPRLFDIKGCATTTSFKFDREEQTASSGTSTSGGQADGTVGYCNEVATLTFGDFDGVTHDNTHPIVFGIATETLQQKYGWGGFGLTSTGGDGVLLPMIGYSMWNRDFGKPGSNFGHIMDHVKID